MSTRIGKRIVVAIAAVVGAIGLTVAWEVVDARSDRERAAVRPGAVVFVPGCCEGFAEVRLDRLATALRNGAWQDTDWIPLAVWVNGVPAPREGELPATPERGNLAASIRVTLTGDRAERVDVMGVDSTPERARRVKEQVQSGEFGEAVPYATVDRCRYDLDPSAMPALLDKLAMGGIPRIPTRLRPDYTFGVDWPALQHLGDNGRWLVSWRKGPDGQPRLLLAIERTRDAALINASSCLARLP